MLRRTYSVAALAAALLAGCVYAPEAAPPARPEMAGMPAGHMQMSPDMHAKHMAMMAEHARMPPEEHAKVMAQMPDHGSTAAAPRNLSLSVKPSFLVSFRFVTSRRLLYLSILGQDHTVQIGSSISEQAPGCTLALILGAINFRRHHRHRLLITVTVTAFGHNRPGIVRNKRSSVKVNSLSFRNPIVVQ